MFALHVLTQTALLVPAADDLLGFANEKVSAVTVLLRSFAVLAGIGFVILQGVQSRGAMARIVISGLAAGVFIWIVFNVTDLRDRVDNEMNSAPAPAGTPWPAQLTTGTTAASVLHL